MEIHFKDIPLLFELNQRTAYQHETIRKILHVSPKKTLKEIKEIVRKEFNIYENLPIDLVHQGKACGVEAADETLLEDAKIDPRHVCTVVVEVRKPPAA